LCEIDRIDEDFKKLEPMKNNIKNILVPVDFSETSLNALETAISIAKQQRARITLLNVVDSTFMFGFKGVYYISEKTIESIVDVSARMLNPLLKKLKEEHQVNSTSEVKVGLVPQCIVKAAADNDIDLIIMGTHGASGVRRFFIGSIAQKVIKISSCPVLTVPSNQKWLNFEKILFPVRPIKGAIEKYDFLKKLIGDTSASIDILILASCFDEIEKKLLKSLVKELTTKAEKDKIKISGSLKVGSKMSHSVLKMSKSIEADMIVVTSNISSDFKQFFIGPFEQHIVNHATIPVLSVKAKLTNPDSQLVIQQVHESFPSQIPAFG